MSPPSNIYQPAKRTSRGFNKPLLHSRARTRGRARTRLSQRLDFLTQEAFAEFRSCERGGAGITVLRGRRTLAELVSGLPRTSKELGKGRRIPRGKHNSTHIFAGLRMATHLFASPLVGRRRRCSLSRRCPSRSLITRRVGRLAALVHGRRDRRCVSSPSPSRGVSLDRTVSLPITPRTGASASAWYPPTWAFRAPAAAATRATAPVIMKYASPFAIISA